VPKNLVPQRRAAQLLALAGAVLVVWTLALAYRLPSRHTSHHWDVAWVGFDVALALALGATGWSVARRSAWAPSAAAVAATLLLCDAWFDNVLANGYGEQLEAGLEAALVEIPLALFCLWLARNCERAVEAVLGAFGRGR
jgi:peptidoglycan/LPS O-acetylase OafA/YrhL